MHELEETLETGARIVNANARYGLNATRKITPQQVIGQRLNHQTAELMNKDTEIDVSDIEIVKMFALSGSVWKAISY